MKTWRFNGLFDGNTWLEPAYVSVNGKGEILRTSRTPPSDSNKLRQEKVSGWAIPGIPNAHSHAFQYAMAGLAEHLPPGRQRDDFWSWRETMYDLALRITPGQLEAIAAMLYSQMLRMGFTSVAEFHYLHQAPDGKPYHNAAEMGQRLAAAAEQSGIALTLIPVYYHRGGFGEAPSPQQRRFIFENLDAYLNLLEESKTAVQGLSDGNLGFGVHSLRASNPEDIKRLFSHGPSNAPFHIHVAEQRKEVDACLKHWNRSPVQWLLEHTPLDERCHLVHATHTTREELEGIAASKAQVILCPSTEGNLGDGFFPLSTFRKFGGHWCVGTDSHVGLNPFEELRWLDYGSRLTDTIRNPFCEKPGDDSGIMALNEAIQSGSKALGRKTPYPFEPGHPFDAVILDENYPLLQNCSSVHRLSTVVYAGDSSIILGTLRRGKWVVREGRHFEGKRIAAKFKSAMRALGTRR